MFEVVDGWICCVDCEFSCQLLSVEYAEAHRHAHEVQELEASVS